VWRVGAEELVLRPLKTGHQMKRFDQLRATHQTEGGSVYHTGFVSVVTEYQMDSVPLSNGVLVSGILPILDAHANPRYHDSG
jgi:hypothetical protein